MRWQYRRGGTSIPPAPRKRGAHDGPGERTRTQHTTAFTMRTQPGSLHIDAALHAPYAEIMEFKVSGKADSKVEASIGMEISGLVTWTDPTVLDEGALAGRNHAPAAPARKAA